MSDLTSTTLGYQVHYREGSWVVYRVDVCNMYHFITAFKDHAVAQSVRDVLNNTVDKEVGL